MLTDIKRGTKVRNAFNRETFVFSGPLDDPAVARFEVVLEEGGSGGGNALVHVHLGADEHFTVKSGRIRIVVEGKEQLVESGGRAVIPRGKPHFFLPMPERTLPSSRSSSGPRSSIFASSQTLQRSRRSGRHGFPRRGTRTCC